MTKQELRNHPEYEVCMNKIRNYRPNFEFTVYYSVIPTPQRNALKIVLEDAKKQGLIESIAIGLSLEGEIVDERFKRVYHR